MKRIAYIVSAVVLGIVAQFVVHGVLETWVISLLTSDFDRYGLGFSWSTWFTIHHVSSIALLVLGALVGYIAGVRWWRMIYVDKTSAGLVCGLVRRLFG